jgi:hypothetical protein
MLLPDVQTMTAAVCPLLAEHKAQHEEVESATLVWWENGPRRFKDQTE